MKRSTVVYSFQTVVTILIDSMFPVTSKKQPLPYKCSKCGLEGHNSRNCKIEVEAFDSTEIVAGKYVVNECPFKALGKLNKYKRLLGGCKLAVGEKEEVVEEVAQMCDGDTYTFHGGETYNEEKNEEVEENEEVVEEVTQMLWAILDNNKKVRVKIRVSEELSILTIQRFVREKKLYERMIKKLGGIRGKISPKLSSTIICKIVDVTIRHKDVITLRGNHFINDIVVNAFGRLLRMKTGDHVHLFSSHFLYQYMTSGYRGVSKYILNNQIDIEKLKILVFPINSGMHWFTANVNMIDKVVCIYDSIHEPSSLQKLSYIKDSYMKSVVEYLKDLFNISYNNWRFRYKMCPQQPNGYDCGIHTCMHMFSLCINVPFDYDTYSMLDLRAYIFHCIISKTLIIP